jgi:uncharacterized protein YukE
MTFEGKQIPTPESPKGFRHPQINGAFKPLEPTGNALAAAGQYSQIAQKWREGVASFAARMNRSSAAAWDGQAAESSREAIRNYAQRATDLTPELDALATRVGETAQAITTTKDQLPDPGQNFSITSPSTWDFWNNEDPDDQEEKAQQVMADHYVTPFATADGTIPTLSTPVSPTNPLHGSFDDGTDGGEPGGDGSGGGATGGGGDSEEPTDPATIDDPAESEDPADSGTGDSSSDSDASEDTDGGDETSPSSTTPDGATTPASTTPASTTPLTSSPGGGGSGGGASGSPVVTTSPGRAVAGTPGTGALTTAVAAGSTASNAGRSGMSGMGAPGAGRGKGGEDDDTHKIPEYLITAENTEELLGEMPRTIAGGVIGADAASASTPPRSDDPRPRN